MDNILFYKTPAGRWEEALPIGNGHMGGMVHGGTSQECIDLNEDTLWSGNPRRYINPTGNIASVTLAAGESITFVVQNEVL